MTRRAIGLFGRADEHGRPAASASGLASASERNGRGREGGQAAVRAVLWVCGSCQGRSLLVVRSPEVSIRSNAEAIRASAGTT